MDINKVLKETKMNLKYPIDTENAIPSYLQFMAMSF